MQQIPTQKKNGKHSLKHNDMTVYGIPNCDTTQKAIKWLQHNKISFTFHNYKESGIDADKLNQWCKKTGLEKILNKRSTTWRELKPAQQTAASDQKSAVQLMLEHNSIIKRPVIEHTGGLIVGWDEKVYEKELQ